MLQSHSMLCLGEIGISRSLGVALCIVAKHLMVQQGSKCWSWVVERELPWQSQENICNRNYVMVCGPGEDGQRGERIPKGGKKGKGKAGQSHLRCKMKRFLLPNRSISDGWWRRRAKMVASLRVKSPSRVTWFLGTSVVFNCGWCEHVNVWSRLLSYILSYTPFWRLKHSDPSACSNHFEAWTVKLW